MIKDFKKKIPKMKFEIPFFRFCRRSNEIKDKYIYWDTNCYRLLGRQANAKGVSWLDTFLKNLKQAEKKRNIDVRVSYLVLSEMFSHLDQDISSNTYLECKYGLYAALYHTEFNVLKLMLNDDNEFLRFITGKASPTERAHAESIYNILLSINEKGFNDSHIRSFNQQVQSAQRYLTDTKQKWKDTILNNFIKRNDPTNTGIWQLFLNDKIKRSQALTKIRTAKKDGTLLQAFGIGVYEYTKRNYGTIQFPDLSQLLLESIIKRFRPLFDLQIHILEYVCQSGYNLDDKSNDITDYLIVANLEVGKSVFISNESRNLAPRLSSRGYNDDVWLFDKYCESLSVSAK